MSQITVLAFSPVSRDARVLRQVEYLSKAHQVLVIGYGEEHSTFCGRSDVEWRSLGPDSAYVHTVGIRGLPVWIGRRIKRLVRAVLVGGLGRLRPEVYEWAYWRRPERRAALEHVRGSQCHAILANDWDALPVAVRAAGETGARVIFDCHEYAPGQREDQRWWWLVDEPQRRYMLHRYSSSADESLTVSPAIARRLADEFQIDPLVLLNAPARAERRARATNPDRLRLVHHGVANPGRELQRMIRAIALCDERYTLDLMLVGDRRYVRDLRGLARELAPDRVRFPDPVPPEQIVAALTEYDAGIFILPPNTFNHRAALPNKLFDFICAGLAVIIGPSEAMADVVERYACGVVAESFEPEDVARALRSLTFARIKAMQEHAWIASERLNADNEMRKLTDIYDRLPDESDVQQD